MQSTGQSSTQALSLTSTQGRAITKVIGLSSSRSGAARRSGTGDRRASSKVEVNRGRQRRRRMTTHPPAADDWLPIGEVSARTGTAVSALRFYEELGLIAS